ncbi:FkbM family methyltransferase [Caulobacter sp. KR2-114]|uniref:FkbM family methyltransferase n=1 Tax=Caulobacter sp. KR2-114 TaxID=3400912 RepID=UPI003BFF4EE6
MRLTLRQRASWAAHVFKAVTQQHHRALVPLFAPLIPSEAVVLDVGAHAGQFAKLFAGLAPRGHIYAFEPSAYARSVLGPALAAGGRGRVEVVPMGLSDRAGDQVLHTPVKRRGGLGFGIAHLGEDEGRGGEGGGPAGPLSTVDQTIALTTLDAFAQARGLERLDLIKLDIEGWELRALAGGERTLRRFGPALYVEVDDAMLARAGDSAGGLFAWLSELGYVARRAPDLTPAPHWLGAGDYLFQRGGA